MFSLYVFALVLMFTVLALQVALDLTEDEKHYLRNFVDEDFRYELLHFFFVL